MNNELYEVIKIYSINSHKELSNLLLGKSKDKLIALLNDLITVYINDKNSSLLREYITVSIAGYIPNVSKIGYNGFRQETELSGKINSCEAKPQNIISGENKRKLNGGGNFTDYTFARLKKNLKDNPNMLISGFVDGELLYVLEFPFKCKYFKDRLKEQLLKRFPDGDKKGEFLRSANFTFEHYKKCSGLKIIFLSKTNLIKNKQYFVNKFYEFLIDYENKKK
ncbi:MAG: hypothetical protein PHO23_00605 [Candidatus Pacebacteria bacterium]|nr:hypothetical protein [Candidatus Paceibacterota bacterium]